VSSNGGKENNKCDCLSRFADNISSPYFAFILTYEARENTVRQLGGAFLFGFVRKMRTMCLVVITYRRLFVRQGGMSTALDGAVGTVGESILMSAVT
jgi:hypothetical protein